jgi:hypothetical protein
MTLIARKHSSVKQERLRRFVAEHIDALEPGLRIIEAGLRVGRMVVDLVAADTRQTLVLIGVGSVATEKMLIGMLDACIWCLQFPDGLRRLCPEAPIAFTRPPRLVVVAEEVPESFMDLVGCLSFEVECHELAREPGREADAATRPAVGSPGAEALGATPAAPDPSPGTPITPAAADVPVTLPTSAALEATPPPAVGASEAAPVEPEAVPVTGPGPLEAAAPVAAGSAEAGDGKAAGAPLEVAAEPTAALEPAGSPPPDRIPTPSPFSRNGRRIASVGRVAVEHATAPANGTPAPGERPDSAGRAAGRGYVFAQAVRQPQPPSTVSAADAKSPGDSPTVASPTPTGQAAAPEANSEGRGPAVLDSLKLSSTGVSRQWQEFLARLANAQ